MKLVEVVETYEEALQTAFKLQIEYQGLEPMELIDVVNLTLVRQAVAQPKPSIFDGYVDADLNEGDILDLGEKDNSSKSTYRLYRKFVFNHSTYLALVLLEQENEKENDLYFFRYEGGKTLVPLQAAEWKAVQNIFEEI